MDNGMGLSMQEEFASSNFNSSRLGKRFVRTMETLAGQPDKPIWFSGENRAEAKAICRMPGYGKLDREGILRTRREAAIRRMTRSKTTALAVQGTAGLNRNTQTKTEGVGYAGNGKALGVNINSRLAATAEGLAPGASAQSSYNRERPRDDGRTHGGKKTRLPEEKESCRRVQTLGAGAVGVPEEAHIATVCGRGGDMHGLFDEAVRTGRAFPIRMAQNRKTAENTKILDETRKKPCAGKVKAAIPRNSRKSLKKREAVLGMRRRCCEVKRPPIPDKVKSLQAAHKANVIYVREEQPGQRSADKAVGPIERFLTANGPAEDARSAYEKAAWRIRRRKAGRFRHALKPGCAVEKLQGRSMEKTATLALMHSITAAAIMNITFIARIHPHLPCTACFEEDEWKAPYCTANKTKKPPEEPYTIAEAAICLSRPGGPKRAPGDGPPGVKAIWIGLDGLNTPLAYREWPHDSVGQV
jgi:hypothetical protein